MKQIHAILLAAALLGVSAQALAGPPAIYDSRTGKFLGYLSNNQWDRNSTGNPWGRYGSEYSQDSINNPYSRHGSPVSPDSPNNPYTSGGNRLPEPPPFNLPGASPY